MSTSRGPTVLLFVDHSVFYSRTSYVDSLTSGHLISGHLYTYRPLTSTSVGVPLCYLLTSHAFDLTYFSLLLLNPLNLPLYYMDNFGEG